jgi:hypothetical protein
VVTELSAFPGDARQRTLAGSRRGAAWGGRRLVRMLHVLSDELVRDPAAEPRPADESWGLPVGAPALPPPRRGVRRRFRRGPRDEA